MKVILIKEIKRFTHVSSDSSLVEMGIKLGSPNFTVIHSLTFDRYSASYKLGELA